MPKPLILRVYVGDSRIVRRANEGGKLMAWGRERWDEAQTWLLQAKEVFESINDVGGCAIIQSNLERLAHARDQAKH